MRRWVSILAAMAVLPSGCASPPVPRERPEPPTLTQALKTNLAYVAIIGDSFTNGSSSGGRGPNGWPEIVTALLKDKGTNIKTAVAASSGSGYVKHGTKGSVPFVNQISRVVGSQDALVIVFGSPYDQSVLPDSADRLMNTVEHTLFEVKKAAPKAKVLVIGPAWVLPNPSLGILQVRDIVRAQAEAQSLTFVDPLGDNWFGGHSEMVGANGDSPDDAGHLLMAQKIAPIISEQLARQPAP
jgi:hypothetical protein